MVDYTCECCGHVFEIEEYQAVMAPPEHYEHNMCQGCFDASVENEAIAAQHRKAEGIYIEEAKGMKIQMKAPEGYIGVEMPTMEERAAAVCMDCGKPGGQICADCEEEWIGNK